MKMKIRTWCNEPFAHTSYKINYKINNSIRINSEGIVEDNIVYGNFLEGTPFHRETLLY